MFQKIFKNAFYLSLASSLSKIFYLIQAMLIARFLGVEGYGLYSFAFAFAGVFFAFADLGTYNFGLREISRKKSVLTKYAAGMLLIEIASCSIAFLALLIFSLILKTGALPLIAGIVLLIGVIQSAFSIGFYARQRMIVPAAVSTLQSAATLALSAVFIHLGLGVSYLLLSFLISKVIAALILIAYFRKAFGKLNFKTDFTFLINIFKKSFPFLINGIVFSLLFNIGMLMFRFMKGDYAFGIYSAANKVVENLSFLPASLISAAYPAFSSFFGAKKRISRAYTKIFNSLILMCSFIIIILVIFARQIIQIVFSNKFLDAVPVLRILSFTFLTSALISMNLSFLNAVNKTKVNIAISVSLIPIYALSAFFLIKNYNYIGFAVSILLIEIVFLIAQQLFIRKNNKESRSKTRTKERSFLHN